MRDAQLHPLRSRYIFHASRTKDLRYLSQKGVATGRITPYHPIGNSQVERYNGIIWKSVCLNLKTHDLPLQCWKMVLQDVLHAIRSLLSTSTNTNPHERFFGFQWRSTHGSSPPSWLVSPGPVLLWRFVQTNKNDSLVDEVDFIDANPTYANIKCPTGWKFTVSVCDLAPCLATPPILTDQTDILLAGDYTSSSNNNGDNRNTQTKQYSRLWFTSWYCRWWCNFLILN